MLRLLVALFFNCQLRYPNAVRGSAKDFYSSSSKLFPFEPRKHVEQVARTLACLAATTLVLKKSLTCHGFAHWFWRNNAVAPSVCCLIPRDVERRGWLKSGGDAKIQNGCCKAVCALAQRALSTTSSTQNKSTIVPSCKRICKNCNITKSFF